MAIIYTITELTNSLVLFHSSKEVNSLLGSLLYPHMPKRIIPKVNVNQNKDELNVHILMPRYSTLLKTERN